MPLPRRRPSLPAREEVPWTELRRRATVVFLWLRQGWTALSPAEREEVRRLLKKSGGTPRRLSRDEARRLGSLAGKAASRAAAERPPR
jgi:hypothetical protein